MKIIILTSIFLLMVVIGFGQDLHHSQVPALVLNAFQESFPEAKDIDWEKKGGRYQVEFEIGFWNNDHEAWYNEEGKMLRHKEEIAKKDLPSHVRDAVRKNYRYFWISDIEKETKGAEVYYKVELKSISKEWEITFNESGKEIKVTHD